MNSPTSRRLQTRRGSTFATRRRVSGMLGKLILPVVLIVTVVLISRLSYAGFLTLRNITVIGADTSISPKLRTAAVSALDGNYLYLFSRADTLIYPKSSILAAVLASSPEVQSATIKREGLHALVITVQEKTPAVLVCASLPDWTSISGDVEGDGQNGPATDCYFADNSGLIFATASTSSSTASTISLHNYYIPELPDIASTSPSIVGIQAMERETFTGLETLYNGVLHDGIRVEGILVGSDAQDELYVRNNTTPDSDIAVVHFDGNKKPEDTLADFITFWNHMKSDSVSPDGVKFSDIKLQYSPNIYYTLVK